ncbi:MAG: carbohydrate porin [Bdellovibrionota bacterium]
MRFSKKSVLVFSIPAFLASFSVAHSATADQLNYESYFRSGIGRNDKGGAQTCFSNPLAGGHNDFRLGNECGAYGELSLRATPVKGAENEPSFAATTMLSFNFPSNTDATSSNVGVVQLFAEGSHLFGKDYGAWIGRRYYRDIDAHMDDFFYYGGVAGEGAGITHVDVGNGTLSVALFLPTLNDATPFSTPPTTVSTSSERGVPQGRYLDLRLSDFALNEKNHLHFWLGFADQSETTITGGTLVGQTLGNFVGYLAGSRYRSDLENGTNDLALVYGKGLLSRLNTGDVVGHTVGDAIGGSSNLRIVDHATFEHETWAMHALALAELRQDFFAKSKKGWYFSAGIRPVYFVTENFHVAVELGHDEAEDDGYQGGKTLRLTRLTIAPEIVAAKKIWSRPALRFFYSTSFWNNDARGLIGTGAYANDTSGNTWGFQGEVWF